MAVAFGDRILGWVQHLAKIFRRRMRRWVNKACIGCAGDSEVLILPLPPTDSYSSPLFLLAHLHEKAKSDAFCSLPLRAIISFYFPLIADSASNIQFVGH